MLTGISIFCYGAFTSFNGCFGFHRQVGTNRAKKLIVRQKQISTKRFDLEQKTNLNPIKRFDPTLDKNRYCTKYDLERTGRKEEEEKCLNWGNPYFCTFL